MLKTRQKKLEEEAKKEPDYIPTKELHAEEEKPDYKVPWTGLIIIGVILLLIIICIIVICCVRPK